MRGSPENLPLYLLILALTGCGGPTGHGDPDTPGPEEAVVLPTLEFSSPARGAFMGQRDVRVQGKVTAGSAPLASLIVSDTSLPWTPAGLINQPWSPEPGLNILGARLEDEGDERAVDGRAFIWGPVHDPGDTLSDALRLKLGPDLGVLEDLLARVLSDDSLGAAFVGQTIVTDYADITPTSMSWSSTDVSLRPTAGALESSFTLHDVWMDYTADISGLFEVDGSAWMSSLRIDATVALSVQRGQVLAEARDVRATLSGFGMEVEWVPSWAEDWLADWAEGYLQESIESQVAEMIEDLLPSLLDGLAMDFSFGEAPAIDFALDLADLEVQSDGLRLSLDATVSTDPAITLPGGAGSVATEESPPAWTAASGGNFGVLADDDLVNQLLFALWTSGRLSGLAIGNLELGVLMGEQMDPPLGPIETLTIDFALPPVLQRPVQDDMAFNLGIGELGLDFLRDDGVRHTFSVNASTGGTAAFQPGEEGQEVVIVLDGRPAYVQVEVGVLAWDAALDPGDLAALVRMIVPPLLSRSADFLPGVAVPDLVLSDLTDLDSLQGVVLHLEDPAVSTTAEGWIAVVGEFRE